MSKYSNDQHNKVRQLIAEYMRAGHPANTSAIADFISRKVNIKPSRTTIGTILREMGYQPVEQPRWIWKGKE